MGDRWAGIPADAFVEILQRLPPCPRRRLRLVCRHWRNVIDDGTPKPQARTKVLAFVAGHGGARAYVFDDLNEKGSGSRDLKLRGGAAHYGAIMVGTCNGLLCLCRSAGDVVVVNPITGEKLAVPPPSKTSEVFKDAAAYSFAYHPETGLYKIVHFPYHGDGGTFDAVNVFTLGDRSWREVPVPVGSSCLLSLGIVSVDGATYWVAKDAQSVMSLDLKDELVVFVATLPVPVRPLLDLSWHLTTDVRGRLGLTVSFYELKQTRTSLKGGKTEVWMLEDGGRNKKRTWVLYYTVVEPGREALQEIAWPHVTHGEHVLTTRSRGMNGNSVSLHAHHLSETKTHGGVVRIEGTQPWISLYNNCRSLRTFAYVETTEPLALYRCDDGEIGDNEVWNWMFREGRWKLTLRQISAWDNFR